MLLIDSIVAMIFFSVCVGPTYERHSKQTVDESRRAVERKRKRARPHEITIARRVIINRSQSTEVWIKARQSRGAHVRAWYIALTRRHGSSRAEGGQSLPQPRAARVPRTIIVVNLHINRPTRREPSLPSPPRRTISRRIPFSAFTRAHRCPLQFDSKGRSRMKRLERGRSRDRRLRQSRWIVERVRG